MQQLIKGMLLHGSTYRIEQVLGQGSFGITYLALHTALNKKVAIKEFFMKELNGRGEDGSITGMSDGSLSMDYAHKFQKEALNLARLEHPNIVRVTDSFEDNGTFYYVMDYIEGANLNEYVKHNHVSQEEAVAIIRDVANALMYMHEEKHMLHLDLKPGNVMRRTNDGHIFLIDFGLSKHYSSDGQPETSTTIGLGTAGYAPIEQANQAKNGEFRPTIDVYALGATLYKILTCETPPVASELVSNAEQLADNLQNHGIAPQLIYIVTQAMLPNVHKRTRTVREFLDSLLNGNERSITDQEAANAFIDVEATIVGSESQVNNIRQNLEYNEETVQNYVSYVEETEKENNSFNKFWYVIAVVIISVIVFCTYNYLIPSNQERFCEAERILEGKVLGPKGTNATDSVYFPADTLSALPVLKELAKKQYGPAMWYMAYFTAYGLAGIQKDSVAAIESYKKAATQLSKEAQEGDMYAQCSLSLMYSKGNGVGKDDRLAFNWMSKAAEQGYDDAQTNLADHYLYGVGVEESDVKAFEWWTKAAAQKDPRAMLALGNAYINGIGITINKQVALKYFKELASKEYIPAYYQLAAYYHSELDYGKAKNYYEKASNNSDWRGDFGLGILYMYGWGVKADVNSATSYLERAYTATCSNRLYIEDIVIGLYTQLRLADCYYEKEKYTKAFNLYKKLADVENPAAFMKDAVAEAQYMVAVSYSWGNGCKQSYQKSEKWRKKALANGYKER